MRKSIDGEKLKAILESLSRPAKMPKSRSADRLLPKIASEGWASFADIEDITYLTDVRIGNLRHTMGIKDWCELFDIPIVTTYGRPRGKQAAVLGHQIVSAFDTAALLIRLERMGYAIDPAPLVRLLVDAVKKMAMVTGRSFRCFGSRKPATNANLSH